MCGDIPLLNPKAKERSGYPTQKPLLLLERIITLVTNRGDLVVDPFCGSGTTLVAATLTGREALGIDCSEQAIAVAKQRLENPKRTESSVLSEGRDSYRKANHSALSLLHGIDCVPVHRNKGIDAVLTEQVEGRPVPVRVQRKYETVSEAARMLSRASQTKQARLMVLVVTHRGGELALDTALPSGVVAVYGPSFQIREALDTRTRRVVPHGSLTDDPHASEANCRQRNADTG